ncbi:MAG TPA: 30S ribosomal protein S8e [Candidatus Nanoarchaeia archaeon]|nr:30S ribosomal protein S8e [Candidatus Nanoarchaeia archaeon]
MSIIQSRPKRTTSGGRYKSQHKKRKHQIGRSPISTTIGRLNQKSVRTKGGGKKLKLASIESINLYNPKTKKYLKATVKTIVENPANRHFVRRNIITRGAIIETDKGKARVLSRPGQDGVINAVIVE